jgi:hypothetical protein
MAPSPSRNGRRLFVALLVLLVLLDAAVAAIRIGGILSYGRLILFPAEGPVLYALWKVQHGYPLYEWPTRPVFTLTLYNFLFYDVYAWITRALGAFDGALIVTARFVTLAAAIAGAAAQFLASRRLFAAGPAWLLAMMAAVTWMGCAMPGWWLFSIRPDVPGTALAALGMALAVRTFTGGSRGWLAAAGVAFLAAWCFKQSQVGLFAASCVYAAFWRRSIVECALVAAPVVAGAALSIWIGGAAYRANVVFAPMLQAWLPHLPLHWFRSIFLIDLLPWAIAGYAAVVLTRPLASSGWRALREMPARSVGTFGVDLTYLVVATIVTLVLATLMLSRVGSATNHALELMLAASLLCTGVIAGAWEARREVVFYAAAVLVVPMLAFDAALLAGREQGRAATWLQLKVWGDRRDLTTAEAFDRRAALAARLAALPPPIYTEDELFALPWHSSAGRYPAVMIDTLYYEELRRQGQVETGVDGLIRQHYFGAIVLPDESKYVPIAIHAGYRLRDTVADGAAHPLRVLVR